MRSHLVLLAGIVHVPGAVPQRTVARSADPEINYLLEICEQNSQATVPKWTYGPRAEGPPLPLCGTGYFEGPIKKLRKPARYRQWSLESGRPCHDRWRGVYCNSDGRVTSLSLADMNLTELPDPSALVFLEVLNLANNIKLLKSAALPSSVWSMPKLSKLCLSPVGPLDCAMRADSYASYMLAVRGTRPDPYTAPQSLCIGTNCPSANLKYRIPSILPASNNP
jgi:hypothetical protein